MADYLANEVATEGKADGLTAILEEVCRLTDMGFAAVARVTDERWIVCQVLDKIEFGLNPGDELKIKTTICDEIRQHGAAIVIDDVSGHENWRTHPTPMLYGFESYASFPVTLQDGTFYGTLCAIDPSPRRVSLIDIVGALERLAADVAAILFQARASGTAPA